MTKQEAAVVAAYTGIMLGTFSDFHEYAEKLMGRPIFTHEFANEELVQELQARAKPDFITLVVE